MLNSYGNDMTAANSANAAADAMKKDRLGTPEPSQDNLAGQLSTALSSLSAPPASATSNDLPTTNSFGNDMTAANSANAAADMMKKDRLGSTATGAQNNDGLKLVTDALAGSLGASMGLNKPADPVKPREQTWGDLGEKPQLGMVSNITGMGGNF